MRKSQGSGDWLPSVNSGFGSTGKSRPEFQRRSARAAIKSPQVAATPFCQRPGVPVRIFRRSESASNTGPVRGTHDGRVSLRFLADVAGPGYLINNLSCVGGDLRIVLSTHAHRD